MSTFYKPFRARSKIPEGRASNPYSSRNLLENIIFQKVSHHTSHGKWFLAAFNMPEIVAPVSVSVLHSFSVSQLLNTWSKFSRPESSDTGQAEVYLAMCFVCDMKDLENKDDGRLSPSEGFVDLIWVLLKSRQHGAHSLNIHWGLLKKNIDNRWNEQWNHVDYPSDHWCCCSWEAKDEVTTFLSKASSVVVANISRTDAMKTSKADPHVWACCARNPSVSAPLLSIIRSHIFFLFYSCVHWCWWKVNIWLDVNRNVQNYVFQIN